MSELNSALEHPTYNYKVVRQFAVMTVVWGIVGMLVGVLIAAQLAWPQLNLGEYLHFGRLRPLHTNAVIFAFAGNAIFAAIYYSTQRLLKTRMFNDLLSTIHFWGWQLIIVSAAGTAMISRMTTGIAVQITSATVLCENVAGSTPLDLRCFTSEMIMTPKTTTPIATHHQNTIMCSP